MPGETGIVVKEQDTLSEIPYAFFLQYVLQFYKQRQEIHRVDGLAPLEDNQCVRCRLSSQTKSRRVIFQSIFY